MPEISAGRQQPILATRKRIDYIANHSTFIQGITGDARNRQETAQKGRRGCERPKGRGKYLRRPKTRQKAAKDWQTLKVRP